MMENVIRLNATQACADHVNGDGTAIVCPNTECGMAVCGIANDAFYQPRLSTTSHSGGYPAPVTTNAPWGFGGAGLALLLVLATVGIVIARRRKRNVSNEGDDGETFARVHFLRQRVVAYRTHAVAVVSLVVGMVLLLLTVLPLIARADTTPAQVSPVPCGAPIYKPCATPAPQLGPGGNIEPTGGPPLAPQPSGLPQINITPLPAPQPLQQTQCDSSSISAADQKNCGNWGVGGMTNSMLHWLGLPGNMAEVRRQQASTIRTQMTTERVLVHIPDITRNARVRQLWFIMFVFSDAFLFLALPLAGLFTMWWEVTQINWKEILPRYAAAVLTTNLSLWSVQRILHLTNAISSSLASAGVTANLVSPSKEFSFWLAIGVIVVLLILIASDLIRISLLLVGVVLAAPTQLAWMAFGKDNIARGWWRFMFFLFGSTIIQAVLTTAAMWTIWSGQPFLSAGTAIDTWILVIVLLIIAAIPIVLLIKAVTSLGGHAKVHGVRVGKIALGV